MEEKILNFILECAEVQKLVPFSLIEEEFNLILDEALKSVITDALWDNDTNPVIRTVRGFWFTLHRRRKSREKIWRQLRNGQKRTGFIWYTFLQSTI